MKTCPGHQRQSLCCSETQNAPDVTLHDFIGGHQVYIHGKIYRNVGHPILLQAKTTRARDEIINSLRENDGTVVAIG